MTPVQPGGPASSVELVDDIGSSFHSWQRRVLQLPLAVTKYLPRHRACEPHTNWAFAKVLVGHLGVTGTSSSRDLSDPRRPGLWLRRSPTLWAHGTANPQGQYDCSRHRCFVGDRCRDRPRAGAPRTRTDAGGTARGPAKGVGGRDRTLARRANRGDRCRPGRCGLARRAPCRVGATRTHGRHPGQQRRLYDYGPGPPCRPLG